MNSLRLTATALTTLALASCTIFSPQKQEEQPAAPKEAKQEQNAKVTPTAEQQAAATETLQEITSAVESTGTTLSLPVTETVVTPGIPGRSGLRMGRFAPPEEAASAGENAAPTPNTAELRGLRSPSLPKNLPLDINGQSKKN